MARQFGMVAAPRVGWRPTRRSRTYTVARARQCLRVTNERRCCSLDRVHCAAMMPSASTSMRELLEVTAVLGAVALVYVAFERKSRPLGLVATLVALTVFTGVLLAGAVMFP